jgi:hypothetical protein
MEELPDEMALLVLRHIEPLRDTAAVSGTCRRWRRLMLDPHLWSLFHLRTFPTHLTTTPSSSSTTTTTTTANLYDPTSSAAAACAAPELGWRKSFAASARLLKEAMTNRGDVELARRHGYDVLPLAAARTGCLPLAERAMADFGGLHATTAASGLAHVSFSPERGLVDECLFRACTGGFAPIAQVRRCHHQQPAALVLMPHTRTRLMLMTVVWWWRLQLFLGLGARMRGVDFTHAAVCSGNRQLVALLLDHALAGKRTGYGGVWLTDPRLLPAAAERSDVEMLRLLIDRGAATRSLEAIATAAKAGSVACAQLLIDSGFCYPPVPVRDVRTVSHRFNSDLA